MPDTSVRILFVDDAEALFTIDRSGRLRLGEGKTSDFAGFDMGSTSGLSAKDVFAFLARKPLSEDQQTHLTRALNGEQVESEK